RNLPTRSGGWGGGLTRPKKKKGVKLALTFKGQELKQRKKIFQNLHKIKIKNFKNKQIKKKHPSHQPTKL
ncbi:hypothetical protein ACVGWN_06130, partial [Enterobacter hormaechei]